MEHINIPGYYSFASSSPNISFSDKHGNRNVPRYYLQFDNSIVYANFVPPFATLPPAKSCDKVWSTRSQQYRYDVKIDKKKGGGENKIKSQPRKYLSIFIESILRVGQKRTKQTKQVVSIRQPGDIRHRSRCNASYPSVSERDSTPINS